MQAIETKCLTPNEMTPDTNGWKRRHMMEVKRGHPIAAMVEALNSYAVIALALKLGWAGRWVEGGRADGRGSVFVAVSS